MLVLRRYLLCVLIAVPGMFVATIQSAMATTLTFSPGWSLAGNSSTGALTVASMSMFGDSTKVVTVWKWVASKGVWAFYAPSQADGGAALAASKGYDFLTTINAGEGFWVNAKTAFTATLPAGLAVTSSSFQSKLPAGWSLIAIGDSKTPSQFNSALSITPPSVGVTPNNVTTLWAWDPTLSNWYFYAPALEVNGTLSSYVASKGYLDFSAKVLDPTMGFWVNVPTATTTTTISDSFPVYEDFMPDYKKELEDLQKTVNKLKRKKRTVSSSSSSSEKSMGKEKKHKKEKREKKTEKKKKHTSSPAPAVTAVPVAPPAAAAAKSPRKKSAAAKKKIVINLAKRLTQALEDTL